MKNFRIPLSALSTLAVLMLAAMPSQAGLIAHYVFDDGDLLDNEVVAGPALVNAGPTPVTLGAGTAVFSSEPELNTTGDNFLRSNNGADLNLGTFTVSFWIRTSTPVQGGPFQGIFSSRGSGADANSWQYFSDSSATAGTTAQNGETLIRGGVGTQTDSALVAPFTANTWYHVALTSNDPDNTLIMTISSQGGTLGDLANGIAYSRDVQLDDFIIGTNRALNQTYGMELANVRIYDSVESVGPLRSEGPLLSGAVAHYAFEETSGTILVDSSGNGYDGSLVGSGSLDVAGIVGSSAYQPGGDASYGKVTNGVTSFGITGNAARTISLWFRSPSFGITGNEQHRLIGIGNGAAGAFDIVAERGADAGNANRVGIRYGNGNAFYDSDNSGTAFATDTWYHLAAVYDGTTIDLETIGTPSDGTGLTLYVNGVKVDTKAGNLSNGNQALNTIGPDFFFGTRDYSANQAYDLYPGLLDEVRVYQRALSASEVAALAVPTGSSPAVASFTADKTYVETGNPVTLSWTASNFDTLIIEPGTIDAAALSTNGSGSVPITINENTTFTLTATKNAASDSKTVTVTVGPPRPNIVLFLVDDMGVHDTSVPFLLNGSGQPVNYNFNTFYQTPNMETLASTGMRFTTAYAQSVCSPTRCGLLTGRTSARHGVSDWVGANDPGSPPNWRINGVSAAEITLPKQLQAAGYRTIHCGKAHFGVSSLNIRDLGFDVNIAGSHAGQPARYIGAGGYGVPGLEAYNSSNTYLTKALTIEANAAVSKAVGEGRPFFLNMSFYAVHTPFTTNPDATGNYSGAVGGSGGNHAKFATMIEGMDIAVGQIRQKLIDLGVAKNTLIVFLGDNGSDSPATTQDVLPSAPFNDWPMRGKKGSKWEGGARVPFITTWALPDVTNPFQQAVPIPANSIETDIVTTWDLPATLLDLVNLTAPAGFGEDSHSLLPYLSGSPGTHRPQEIAIHYPHEHRSDFFSWIRQGDLKLIYNFQDNTHQLYNLATDPTESNNLASTQPEEAMRLARLLAQKLDAEWGPAGILLPVIASTAPPGNVVSIPNDPATDLDNDGIADRDEDPNLNGLVDAGETNPDNDNTDGDRTRDGDELRTGTDPLDPSNDFTGTIAPDTGSGRSISWPSKPGATYRIETSTTLDPAEWDLVEDNVAAHPSAASTTYPLPNSTAPARFYRIRLN
jgi:arylsulfatase A-like enzyme